MASTYAADKAARYRAQSREIAELCPKTVDEFRVARDGAISAASMHSYIYDLYAFFQWWKLSNPDLKDREVSEITVDDISLITSLDINEYFADLREKPDGPKSPKRFARIFSALNSYFCFLTKYGRLQINPMDKVERAHIPKDKEIVRLKDDEPDRLITVIKRGYPNESAHERALRAPYVDRDVAIISLLLTTGIRVSECAGLNKEDVNMEQHSLRVTRKGGFRQLIAIGDQASEALAKYMKIRERTIGFDAEEDKALFLNRQRKRLTEPGIRRLVEKYAAALGLDRKITPHKLRKTYGTNLYSETRDIYLVAEALGHSSVNTTTQHYVATKEEDLQAVRDVTPLSKPEE